MIVKKKSIKYNYRKQINIQKWRNENHERQKKKREVKMCKKKQKNLRTKEKDVEEEPVAASFRKIAPMRFDNLFSLDRCL